MVLLSLTFCQIKLHGLPYYTETVLPKVSNSVVMSAQRPEPNSILLHDIAGPHKAEVTESYLQDLDIHVLDPILLTVTFGFFN